MIVMGASWCRAHVDGRTEWWPGRIGIFPGAYVQLHEIPANDESSSYDSSTTDVSCDASNAESSDQEATVGTCGTIVSDFEESSSIQLNMVRRSRPDQNYSWQPPYDLYLRPPGNTPNWLKNEDTHVVGNHTTCGRVVPTPARTDKAILRLADHIPTKRDQPLEAIAFPREDLDVLLTQVTRMHAQQPFPLREVFDILPEDLLPYYEMLRLDTPNTIFDLQIYTDGSYRKSRPEQGSAWAFVVLATDGTEPFLLGYGFGLVSTDSFENGWTGAQVADARTAEVDALIHALEWAFSRSYAKEHNFNFDAQTVGHIAAGRWRSSTEDPQIQLLRCLAQTMEVLIPTEKRHQWNHVKSHTGIVGNEIADALAKHALRTQSACGGHGHVEYLPFITGPRPLIQWLWYATVPASDTLPIDSAGIVRAHYKPPPISKMLPVSLLPQESDNSVEHATLRLTMVTYNVGTLLQKDLDGVPLRPGYLRDQAMTGGINFLFLQETRTRTSNVIESSTHIRFVSEAHHGNGGTEIWLLKHDPKTGKKCTCLQDAVILLAEPQILLLRTNYSGRVFYLLSAHAPHTGCPMPQHETFWQHLSRSVSQLDLSGADLIIGIDANAHFDHENPPFLGDAGLEPQKNIAADKFLQFLQQTHSYLPSTFQTCHSGSHWTWNNPSNGTTSRCDYLVLPLAWDRTSPQTHTMSNLDAGGRYIDHIPLFCHVELYYEKPRRAWQKRHFDREAFHKAPTTFLEEIFSDLPTVSWETSPDEHALQLSQAISTRLQQAFPPPQVKPRRSYITEETWQIRRERIRLRRYLIVQIQLLQQAALREAFTCLKRRTLWNQMSLFASTFKTMGQIFVRKQHLTTKLRKALRSDRTMFLNTMAEQAEQLPAHEFYRHMRQVGVAGKHRQRGFRPLPQLCDAQGNYLQTPKQIAQRWQQFFGDQEDGYCVTVEQLEHLQALSYSEPSVLPRLEELPTLWDLERQFQQARPWRAFFNDIVPGDVLHRLPHLLAAAYYPLLLKQAMTQIEPLLFKGGVLVPAYKNKGSASRCESYRSLLVSSNIGKAFHSLYRRMAIHELAGIALPLQIGGRPGQSVQQASQCLLAMQAFAKKKKYCIGFLFIDIQNAFYRLLRQHLTDKPYQEGLRALFASLQLPDDAYEEFLAQLQEATAFDQCGLSAHLQAMFAAFLSNPWFVVPQSEQFTVTRRGSRPGDSIADLCFTFAFAKILRRCFQHLTDQQGITLSWSGHHEPPGQRPAEHKVEAICPIWADDLAITILHHTVEGMIRAAELVSSFVLDTLATAGMRPNMSDFKTELLLALCGKGSYAHMQKLLRDNFSLQTHAKWVPERLKLLQSYIVAPFSCKRQRLTSRRLIIAVWHVDAILRLLAHGLFMHSRNMTELHQCAIGCKAHSAHDAFENMLAISH